MNKIATYHPKPRKFITDSSNLWGWERSLFINGLKSWNLYWGKWQLLYPYLCLNLKFYVWNRRTDNPLILYWFNNYFYIWVNLKWEKMVSVCLSLAFVLLLLEIERRLDISKDTINLKFEFFSPLDKANMRVWIGYNEKWIMALFIINSEYLAKNIMNSE